MTGERPDDAREPDGPSGPADGTDGQEAQRASASDAPFRGLRSAADIFGAPRAEDDWPSRRERREAERAARETGAPLPEPFEPEPGVTSQGTSAGSSGPDDEDAGATQAIPMSDELREPSVNPQAAVEHQRETLGDRIPPAAPVPPTSTASHPSSISLPTAMRHRDQRAAENRAVDEERRRTDPFGQGRSDVDWLGRATGSQPPAPEPTPTGPVAQPIGVGNVLPPTPAAPTNEPPSFTELLRLQAVDDADGAGAGAVGGAAAERPFDWAIRDDETGEVPTTLTTDRFDTTAFGAGSWSLADEADDDVVSGEVDTPAGGLPTGLLPAPRGDAAATTALPAAGEDAAATTALPAADEDAAATTALPAPADGRSPDAETPAPTPVSATPWWTVPDGTVPDDTEPDDTVPPAAAPPLVEPAAPETTSAYPAHLPPSVGQDLGALADASRSDTSRSDAVRSDAGRSGAGPHDDDQDGRAGRLPAAAPEDLDQSEWDGRETSDTSAIKDLFGTAAVGQLGGTGYDPDDAGTRMMPAVGEGARPAAPAHAPGPGRTRYGAAATGPAAGSGGNGNGDRDNFINEGFGRLRSEGKRGKQLLIVGAVVLIVVLLVAVFGLTRWILGNSIDEESAPAASTSSQAAAPSAAPSQEAAAPSSTPESQSQAQTLQFATTPAAPGVHPWNELAGGECLSPFTNAWSETYTVVDCSVQHIAQLTARVPVRGQQWPGSDALGAQASQVCQSSQAIDTAAAAAYGDVQVQGSYAPDQATRDSGNRSISCFATRSSGQPLTGSLAPDGA
ncbi:hypothetical protein [Curtobacterium caseinilyticum]|uniref:Septum formation-related domain-containing protein n=1 Tax=Curtobacterium caseinilyticum TaxID=3055137 RepID=A0ABT7TR40_9MICO|nr:hypothetical protein [Curtobacterium caseinilyticum]MDM7891990.1 hypothetical protein [Curtobacterium caseinilyticum]